MKTLYSAYCPNAQSHTSGPVDTPTADYVTTSKSWDVCTGYVEVFACTICGVVFGRDCNGLFVTVPDECVS